MERNKSIHHFKEELVMSKKYFEAKNTEEANANEVPKETKEEQKMEVATTMTLGQRVGNMVGKGVDAVGNGISKVTHSKGFKAAAIIGGIGAALVAGMAIANRNDDNDDYDEDDSDNDIYVDSIDVTDEDDEDDDCNSSDDYATEETEA
jgi:hypothetical protein